MSATLVAYVLKAAVRDKFIISLILALIFSMTLALFVGSSPVTEKYQFSAVFMGSGLRLAGVVGLVLFAVSFIRRSFETKDVEFLLSRPISRVAYIVSCAVAFSVLALILAAVVSGIIAAFCAARLGVGHAALWSFSLMVEYIIMVNVALFFAMVLPSTPAGAMAAFAFYILARLIGQLLGIAAEPEQQHGVLAILSFAMNVISVIIPRLDLMAQSSWLVYGGETSVPVHFVFVALQGAVFTFLVTLASIVDLARRQF